MEAIYHRTKPLCDTLVQCLVGMWKRRLGCHAGRQEVGRCRTRGEYQEMCNILHMPPLSSNKAVPTLALKPRGDITRSPKQEYQWPHKKDSCSPKILQKKSDTLVLDLDYIILDDVPHRLLGVSRLT